MGDRAEINEIPVQDYLRQISGVVAVNVSLEEYLTQYAAESCEWFEGTVITMSPVSRGHDALNYYLRQLISAYFELRPLGQVRGQPFVLHLPQFPRRRREPDLMVILNEHLSMLTQTAMEGPPDICIEILSDESLDRDLGTKLREYEQGGVTEYWIFDTQRKVARFHQRDADGQYIVVMPDEAGHYTTPLLPGLVIHVPTLWQDPLPGPGATFEAVRKMLGP